MEAAIEQEVKSGSSKAVVSLAHFQKALRVIAPAIPGNSCAIAGLRSVRIQQLTEGLALEATDIDSSVRALIPENTELATALIVPSDRLVPYVKTLEGLTVSLASSPSRVTLQCGKPKFLIPRMNFPFPEVSYKSDAEGFEMDQADLLRALRYTAVAIGDEEKYTLNGILLEADGATLHAVAMDGHRMAVYSRPLAKQFRYFLPERLVRLLFPVIVEGKEPVHIQEEGSSFLASITADIPVFVSCRKVAGQFPNWQKVVPGEFVPALTVNAEALLRSVGRCLLVGDQKSHAVDLTLSMESIDLKAIDAQAGEAMESVSAQSHSTFDPQRVGVNGAYLAQALKNISGDLQVMLPNNTDGPRPVLFRAHPADGEVFTYIVMSMNLKK